MCGEGGEYESFTLDCPLFKKKILMSAVIITSCLFVCLSKVMLFVCLFVCSEESEVVVHSDDAFAPVAYLKLNKLVLQEKQVSTMFVW